MISPPRTSLFVASSFALLLTAFAALPIAAAGGSAAKVRGAQIFASRGCTHCHGVDGVGGGRGPDLQEVRKRLTHAQIAHQIHDGGKGMPAYGDQLSDTEIKDLVAYLSARRKVIVPKPKPPADPDAPPASF